MQFDKLKRREFITLLGGTAGGRLLHARSSRQCRWSGFSTPGRHSNGDSGAESPTAR
jgi:hypothetical protein